jgi:hypothetical protein
MGQPVERYNTTQPLPFLLILSSDHITGATGKTPTVTICKTGGGFATPAGAVTEIASGWYQVAANAADANTLGPLLLHATASGCDPRDAEFSVVNYNPTSVLPVSVPTDAIDGTVTALDLINGAFEIIGVKSLGQDLEGAIVSDGFRRLNSMINSWGTQPLTMTAFSREVFDITASQSDYTVGPGGDWDTVRPLVVVGVSLIMTNSSPSIEIPLSMLTQNAYAAIAVKDLTSTLPTQAFWNPTYPPSGSSVGLGTMKLWPKPTDGANDIALYTQVAVTSFTSLTMPTGMAPGYREALEYNLACRLCAPYGRPVQPDVLAYAKSTLATVKRQNTRLMDLMTDSGLTPDSRQGTFNILVGP